MQKKVYLEWMRIIAIALVIFNHLPGYSLYGASSGAKQLFYMIVTMITRINVPLFLMISGSLLLNREEDFRIVTSKRVIRHCLILLIFEGGLFIAYFPKSISAGATFEHPVRKYILGVIEGNLEGTGSYWFIYAYLGLLLMLPFMQRIAQKLERQDFIALLVMHFIFSTLIPMINLELNVCGIGGVVVNSSFSIPLVTMKAFFYPLVGYYLDIKIDINKMERKHFIKLIIVGVVGILLSCLCTYYEGSTTGNYTQRYVQLFDYLTAIVFFCFIKYLVTRAFPKLSEGRIAEVICLIGSLSYGIYLIDPYLKLIIYQKYVAIMELKLPTLIVSGGWIVISMFLGGLITFVLKKLPVFRKIL